MRYTVLALSGSLLVATACTEQPTAAPSPSLALASANVTSVTTPSVGPWARIVEGETGPGSLYALYIPTDWNGKAVYYVHGIRPPLAPITLDDQDNFFAVRDALGAQHYAFAYSSFSENGLAEKDGAQRTHQLRGLLASELGQQPMRNYLAGYSLGSAIALDLAETFPAQYDGALVMCGMVGGTPTELQYIGDVRALFDFYYPNVLPGDVITVPSVPPTLDQVKALVVGAISANPIGLYAIASTAQTPLAFAPIGSLTDPTSTAFQSLVGSLITALYYQLLGTPDVSDRVHGHSPYANDGITYTLGTPVLPIPGLASLVAASNAGVKRYTMTPDAVNYLEKYFVPSGALRIPVVSVHNLWDPLVPYLHEPVLAGIVSNAGTSSMLTQQAIPNYGHCNFSTQLVLSSFQSLVNRVEGTGQ